METELGVNWKLIGIIIAALAGAVMVGYPWLKRLFQQLRPVKEQCVYRDVITRVLRSADLTKPITVKLTVNGSNCVFDHHPRSEGEE